MPPCCTECKRLSERIDKLEAKIQTLQQIWEDGRSINMDSMITVEATGQAFTHRTPAATFGIADTSAMDLPRNAETTGNTGPKTSTPTRAWTNVARRKDRRNWASDRRIPRSRHTRQELPLKNRYAPLATLEMHDYINDEDKVSGNDTHRAKQSHNISPRFGKIRGKSTPNVLLIGDTITENVEILGTQILTMTDASVKELTELLPEIICAHPKDSKIIIHTGSHDVLKRRTGSEILKKDFSQLLHLIIQHDPSRVAISGPIPTVGKRSEAFSRLLNLNSWLTSECSNNGIQFIDNFNVFWNCKDHFQRDEIHPNRLGTRRLAANLNFAISMFGEASAQTKVKAETRPANTISIDTAPVFSPGLQENKTTETSGGINFERPTSSERHGAPDAPSQLTPQSPSPPSSPITYRGLPPSLGNYQGPASPFLFPPLRCPATGPPTPPPRHTTRQSPPPPAPLPRPPPRQSRHQRASQNGK